MEMNVSRSGMCKAQNHTNMEMNESIRGSVFTPFSGKKKKRKSQTVSQPSVSSGQTAHPQDTKRNIQLSVKGSHSPPDEGTCKSQPLPKGKTTDPKDSEGNDQPIDKGLPSTIPDEGTGKTMPLSEGSREDKDSERLKALVDMESQTPHVTDLSRTDAKYQLKEDSDDDVFEAKEEMGEDIKEPETEETQTHHSPKHTNKEEYHSSSPNKDQPESSTAKKTDVSDSESSSCSKSLKPYDTTCQSLIGNCRKSIEKGLFKEFESDRGGEYISQEFKDYLKDYGNVQKLTPPYTPQHNEVSKRKNRTLLDMIWGCEALVKRDTPDKLQQRSVKCIFIGYLKEMMSYYFYFPPENKIVVARTHRAPDCLCLNVEVEEYSLGDLNEPTNYKAALLDLESDNWVDAMNAEMQSMKDNQVWCLVDLPPNFDCYCDAGFETDRDDIKSQTVYVFVLNGGAIDWKSSKQSTTAMSATEAEYIATLEVEMEAVWIMKFILELAHTDDNLSDPFTKALPKGKLTQHARSMGLHLASRCSKVDPTLNKKVLEAIEAYTQNSTNLTELLTLVKTFDFSGLKSLVESLKAIVDAQNDHLATWAKSSSNQAGVLVQQLLGENFAHTATEEPPSHTEGLKADIHVIDITPPEQPESPPVAPKADRGKGIASDDVESPKKLVKASSKVRHDLHEPVRIPYEIHGELYHLTNDEIQEHLEKEEKMKKAVEEAKLLAMSKPELIKVVNEETSKAGINHKFLKSEKGGQEFKKIQDVEFKVLNMEHAKKLRGLENSGRRGLKNTNGPPASD
ncbi:retrotransposon protein, putative, ty1-copia subclass [Tanacetum coccineum]